MGKNLCEDLTSDHNCRQRYQHMEKSVALFGVNLGKRLRYSSWRCNKRFAITSNEQEGSDRRQEHQAIYDPVPEEKPLVWPALFSGSSIKRVHCHHQSLKHLTSG